MTQIDATATAVVGSERPQGGPAARRGLRIVHVSDLHFGRGFDVGLWEHVKDSIEREAPDLVVVSGDLVNSPWPFMLAVARRELEALAQRVRTTIVVVPGNHDVAILGNVYRARARRRFLDLFAEPLGPGEPDGRAEGLPTFAELNALGRFARLRARLAGYWALARRARRAAASPAGRARVFRDPAGRALVLLLDSTFRGSLASGFIDEREIYGLDAEVHRVRERSDLREALALRLAVLHHHPLPLPYSIVAEQLTSYEPFLVLRNAGTLLRELWRHDFDLVLHGHKHFHSFARVSYGAADEDGARMLSVLAAGSASVRHAEAGRNSLNVIEVHENGRVLIKPEFFGGGLAANGAAARVYVQPLAELKYRNFRRAREAQGLSARLLARRVVVDRYGAGEVELQVEGLRVHGRHGTLRRRHVLGVNQGRIDPTAVELRAPSAPGLRLRCEAGEPSRELTCWAELDHALEVDGEPAAYALRFTTPNGFLASAWEGETADEPGDGVRVHVGYPVEELAFDLTLPAWPSEAQERGAPDAESDDVALGQPYVRCLRPRAYPALTLDAEREALAVAPAELVLDGELTAHEQAALMRVGDRRFVLRIAHPMVGYTYELRWRLPQQRLRSALVVGQTRDLQRALLDLRAERLAGQPSAACAALRAELQRLLGIFGERFASEVREERLGIGLMAYDAAERALVLADGAYNWQREPDLTFSIPFGEGLAGAAFKQRRVLLYARPELQRTRGGRAYLYDGDQASARTRYQALVCVPLVHPARELGDEIDAREVVGALSFGSDSPSSGLLTLLDLQREESDELLGDLFMLGQEVLDVLPEPARAMLVKQGDEV